jgi:hypothetical protein
MGKSYKKKTGGFLGFGEGANTATVPNSGPSYWQQLTGFNQQPQQQQQGFYTQQGQQGQQGFYPRQPPRQQQGQQGFYPRQPPRQQQGQQQRFRGGSNAVVEYPLADANHILNGGRKSRRRTRKNKTRRVKSRRGKSRRGKSRRR